VADFTKAIELATDWAEAYFNRGHVYSMMREYDKAEADFTKVIELDPNNGAAYSERAVMYYVKKMYAESKADVVKAKELGGFVSPDFVQALENASGGK
jgi:tetratricopeptide (TPR) repeat protein